MYNKVMSVGKNRPTYYVTKINTTHLIHTCGSCGRPPRRAGRAIDSSRRATSGEFIRVAGRNHVLHLDGAPLGAPMSFWMYCTVETLCGITTVLPNSTTPSAVGTETIVRMPALAACRNL